MGISISGRGKTGGSTVPEPVRGRLRKSRADLVQPKTIYATRLSNIRFDVEATALLMQDNGRYADDSGVVHHNMAQYNSLRMQASLKRYKCQTDRSCLPCPISQDNIRLRSPSKPGRHARSPYDRCVLFALQGVRPQLHLEQSLQNQATSSGGDCFSPAQ